MAEPNTILAIDPESPTLHLAMLRTEIEAQREEYALAVKSMEGVAPGPPNIGVIMAQHNERIYALMSRLADAVVRIEERVGRLEFPLG